MKRNATALSTITHADDEPIAKNQVILGMDAGQFDNLQAAGMVREATDAEVVRARGDKAPAAKKKAAASRKRKAAPIAKGDASLAERTSQIQASPLTPSPSSDASAPE